MRDSKLVFILLLLLWTRTTDSPSSNDTHPSHFYPKPYTYWVLELPKWSRVGGILVTIRGIVKERNLRPNLAKEQGMGEGSQENVILYISHEDIVVCGIPFMYSFILFLKIFLVLILLQALCRVLGS